MLAGTDYPITMSNVREGFSLAALSLPPAAVAAAFATFGITGVGASELYAYPYWCLEKGYARFTGRCCDDPEWVARARGWMRVMILDAWVSMVVYTVATVAFYFLGAAVLYSQDLHPEGPQMIVTLAEMYVPTFGAWAKILFMFGAWAVLFKTLYVASAGHARLSADFLSLAHLVKYDQPGNRHRWIQRFCIFYPTLALVLYLAFREPKWMVTIGGYAHAVTIPVIAGAAIYLRYYRTDPRLAPSRFSDAGLWLSFALISAVAIYAVVSGH
jgi:Mn2+/Fe2+ NRAMP family transporter